MKALHEIYENLEDYRRVKSVTYPLIEIIMITICASICGLETWNEIEMFGKIKEKWLRKFLELKNGIPTHDTFNRFFANMDPEKLEECFAQWITSIAKITDGEVISIDGKTIRGAKEHGQKSFVHMVSAWANGQGLSLGQVKVDEKSNEITAIPQLLNILDIKNCFVTIDAMGCQTQIAKKIKSKKGFYILAVKDNQKELSDNIEDSFRFLKSSCLSEDLDAGHGRVEKRICSVIYDLSHIERPERWADLKSIIRIETERYIKTEQKTEKAIRYYISNSESTAEDFNKYIRKHWAVENNLHWQLDVSFNEDRQRKRKGHSAQNFSLINKSSLMLLKRETSVKLGMKSKRMNAALDETYLEKILEIQKKN